MRMYHRALFVLVLTTMVVGSMSIPRPEAGMSTAAQGAGKARRARKRLARSIRKKGLASLPPVSGALASHGAGGAGHMAAEVVGTPPTLVELGAADPTTVFWQPGVVAAIANGTPTQEQCSEFWGNQTDGTSAGMGACHMAEDLAQAFGHVLQAENSLCYMRNIPTPANLASGGLQVVSGDLPGGISRLFAVPAETERLVEVQVTGEQNDQPKRVMLRVASAAANAAAGNLYAVDLYFCPMTVGATPTGYERLTLGTDGHFQANQGNNDDGGGGSGTNMVDGWVVGSGPGARWDTTRPRSLDILYGNPQGTFKSSVQLSGDVISNRSWSNWGGGDWRSFTMTRFSGSGPTEVRFVAGAFEGINGPTPNLGTAEYRDPIYVSAPGLDLVSQVTAVDMNTDPFFATPPSMPTIDVSGYSCDVTGDVVLAMDFANPTIAAIKADCEGPRLDNVRICEDNPTINLAMQNSPSVCNFPH